MGKYVVSLHSHIHVHCTHACMFYYYWMNYKSHGIPKIDINDKALHFTEDSSGHMRTKQKYSGTRSE